MDVYDGPLRLDIALQRVDQERARALASDPVRLAGVVDQVSDDLRERGRPAGVDDGRRSPSPGRPSPRSSCCGAGGSR